MEETATVLIAGDQESWSRTLESILAPLGYPVRSVSTGVKALAAVRELTPVIAIVDSELSDLKGTELCQLLRKDSNFGPTIPIFLTSTLPLTREQRLAALQCGAWDCYSVPFDAAEFLAKLTTFAGVKRELDRATAESISPDGTGLYSRQALVRIGQNLLSHATRHSEPLAIVVFGPSPTGQEREQGAAETAIRPVATLSSLLRILPVASRQEDFRGLLGPQEIAILAPATEEGGAVRLAERLLQAAELTGQSVNPRTAEVSVRLVAGCLVVSTRGAESLEIETLLGRAHSSYLSAQRLPSTSRLSVEVL